MSESRYGTARAFRQALDARIRSAARAEGVAIPRYRQLVVVDRFLARLGPALGERLVVKGAMALEYRLPRARTTMDLDARGLGSPEVLVADIQAAARIDLGDYFEFGVLPHPRHPVIQGEGVVYQGFRFKVVPELGGEVYGNPFGFDVSLGDPILGAPEPIAGRDFLAFAGIPPGAILVYPRETHLAEKLHALTLPRSAENTRVKDLPDLALLARLGPLVADRLREAIETVFTHRATHPVPTTLPEPPAAWARPYAEMVAENELPWRDLPALLVAVRTFLGPVLIGRPGNWDPTSWTWGSEPAP